MQISKLVFFIGAMATSPYLLAAETDSVPECVSN
jgi:hypothetical protein